VPDFGDRLWSRIPPTAQNQAIMSGRMDGYFGFVVRALPKGR